MVKTMAGYPSTLPLPLSLLGRDTTRWQTVFSSLVLEALAGAMVASTSRTARATLTRTTAHHGLSPRTIHSRFALGGLGPHESARGGLRQRHLVVGAVVGGGGGAAAVVTTDHVYHFEQNWMM